MIIDFFLIFIAYLIGSIPNGFLLARILGIQDIRAHGSGNIGATNVARILGKKYFVLILLLDTSKAFLYLSLLSYYLVDQIIIYYAAASLLLGNVFSIFLRGHGGKGVSTAFGIMLALQPIVVLYVLSVWLIVFILTRTVGIASVVSALCLSPIAWYCVPNDYAFVLLSIFSSVIILWRHQENIRNYIQ